MAYALVHIRRRVTGVRMQLRQQEHSQCRCHSGRTLLVRGVVAQARLRQHASVRHDARQLFHTSAEERGLAVPYSSRLPACTWRNVSTEESSD